MDLPAELPVMTLPEATLFPGAVMPLYLFEARYRRMLKDVLATHRMFVVARQKPGVIREAPMPIAGLGLVRAAVTKADGTSNVALLGLARVELIRRVRTRPYRLTHVRLMESRHADSGPIRRLSAKLLDLVAVRIEQGFSGASSVVRPPSLAGEGLASMPSISTIKQGFQQLAQMGNPGQLADLVACSLLPLTDRQIVLEAVELEQRLRIVIRFLTAEIRRHRKKSSL